MVEAECAEAQIKAQVVLEMTSHEGMLQKVVEGVELTILPELDVRFRLVGAGLQIIDLYDPAPRHSAELAYRGDRYRNIAAREFGTLCRRP